LISDIPVGMGKLITFFAVYSHSRFVGFHMYS
jgi:hypothetical protein